MADVYKRQCIAFALFLFYAIQVYLVFVLVVPVYCWYIFRKVQFDNADRKTQILLFSGKIVAITAVTGVVTVIANRLVTRCV